MWPYKRCCRNGRSCIIAFVFVLAAWLIFFDARYLNANGFIKSAIIVLIASVWTAFADDICEFLIFGTRQITIKSVNFSDWTSNICVNANVYAIVLVSGVIIASILFVAGGIKALLIKNKLVFLFEILLQNPSHRFLSVGGVFIVIIQ